MGGAAAPKDGGKADKKDKKKKSKAVIAWFVSDAFHLGGPAFHFGERSKVESSNRGTAQWSAVPVCWQSR
jgi:hypothetical protein